MPPASVSLLDFFSGKRQKLALVTSRTNEIWKYVSVVHPHRVWSEDSGLWLDRNLGSHWVVEAAVITRLFRAPSEQVTSGHYQPLCHPLDSSPRERFWSASAASHPPLSRERPGLTGPPRLWVFEIMLGYSYQKEKWLPERPKQVCTIK